MVYSKKLNDSKGEETEDRRSSIRYWLRWIKNAKENKHAKRHRRESREAWDEYEKESRVSSDDQYDGPRPYPIYFSSCKTLESAYFAQNPEMRSRRKFEISDTPALVAALITDRLGDYHIENGQLYPTIMKSVQNFIHTDMATTQVIYEADVNEERIEMEKRGKGLRAEYYMPGEEEPYEGEDDLFEDDNGPFISRRTVSNPRIYVEPALYDDMLFTPEAKCESQIKEKGYYFAVPREEAEERFNVKGKIAWKKGKRSERDDSDEDVPIEGDYIDGWECHCKYSGKIYVVSPDCYPTDFLEIREYGLAGFFPSPPAIIGSPPAKHMYPTPMFIHLRPTLDQLHSAYNKVFELIDSIRRRCLVDGSCPELLDAFDELNDQEFIVVENLGELVNKIGNIQNLVWYLPVQELVQAIKELMELDSMFRANFNEWFGVPDILRGVSDPMDTAAGQQIATGTAHDRFRTQKALVNRLVRDTLEMMIDLSLKKFPDELIAQIVGYQFMSPEYQAVFAEALALARDDKQRLIRVDIQTNSTTFSDENRENANRIRVAEVTTNIIHEIGGLLQQGQPQMAAIALTAGLGVLEGVPGNDTTIEMLRQYGMQVIQQAMQPQDQGPPPPDYEMMKLEIKNKEVEIKDLALQLKKYEIDRREERENNKIAIQQMVDRFEAALKEQSQQFTQRLEALYFQLDSRAQDNQDAESFAEEDRLARQVEIEGQAAIMEAVKPAEPKEPKQPAAVIINNNTPSNPLL